MIDLRLATALKRAGVPWHPAPGDRFAVPQPELLGQVFTLSEMTIEAYERPGGTVLGFNGTTEWALDSVQAAEAVWLPAEHQLRGLLGGAFRALRVIGAPAGGGAHAGPSFVGASRRDPDAVPAGALEVLVAIPGRGERAYAAPVAEDAYALALLALLDRATR